MPRSHTKRTVWHCAWHHMGGVSTPCLLAPSVPCHHDFPHGCTFVLQKNLQAASLSRVAKLRAKASVVAKVMMTKMMMMTVLQYKMSQGLLRTLVISAVHSTTSQSRQHASAQSTSGQTLLCGSMCMHAWNVRTALGSMLVLQGVCCCVHHTDGTTCTPSQAFAQCDSKYHLNHNLQTRVPACSHRQHDLWVIGTDPQLCSGPTKQRATSSITSGIQASATAAAGSASLQPGLSGMRQGWVRLARSLWHGPNQDGKFEVELLGSLPPGLGRCGNHRNHRLCIIMYALPVCLSSTLYIQFL